MKKMSLVIVFSTVFAGLAFAGTEVAETQMASALPQPSTVLLCTVGMAFIRCLGRHLNKRIP